MSRSNRRDSSRLVKEQVVGHRRCSYLHAHMITLEIALSEIHFKIFTFLSR